MRVAIIKSSGYLDNVILRILNNNGINGDFINKISTNTILQYDALIFTHQNNIPNIAKVMEQIVLARKTTVVYVNKTLSVGHLYNLIDDLFFHLVEEAKLEVLLPSLLKSTVKYTKVISRLENEVISVKQELSLLKSTNKAKAILMNKGFSEAESHKYIINKAMELRVSKKRVVNLIIENKIDI